MSNLTKPAYLLRQDIAEANRKANNPRKLPRVSHLLVSRGLLIVSVCVVLGIVFNGIRATPVALSAFDQIGGDPAVEYSQGTVPGVEKIVVVGAMPRDVKQFVSLLRKKGFTVITKQTRHSETVYSIKGTRGGTFHHQVDVVHHLISSKKAGKIK